MEFPERGTIRLDMKFIKEDGTEVYVGGVVVPLVYQDTNELMSPEIFPMHFRSAASALLRIAIGDEAIRRSGTANYKPDSLPTTVVSRLGVK